MNPQDTLTKAIEIAIQHGWKFPYSKDYLNPISVIEDGDSYAIYNNGEYENWGIVNIEAIIYSHDFAKSLWPNKVVDNLERHLWKGHLQNMVISENPLEYLSANLPDKGETEQ